jgi:hypothetical protein
MIIQKIGNINKCPIIILAVNRVAKIIGYIINLILLINTLKGIKIKEVP